MPQPSPPSSSALVPWSRFPFALIGGGLPHAPATSGPVIAFIALALAGTVLPFWLFAYGQSRVAAELAGAFVNLEPLVGALVGWVAFGDPVGPWQIFGAFAVIAGILLSLLPPEFATSLSALVAPHRGGRRVLTRRPLVDSCSVVGVAQLVELLVVVQAVGGSSPLAHPFRYALCLARSRGPAEAASFSDRDRVGTWGAQFHKKL